MDAQTQIKSVRRGWRTPSHESAILSSPCAMPRRSSRMSKMNRCTLFPSAAAAALIFAPDSSAARRLDGPVFLVWSPGATFRAGAFVYPPARTIQHSIPASSQRSRRERPASVSAVDTPARLHPSDTTTPAAKAADASRQPLFFIPSIPAVPPHQRENHLASGKTMTL